MTSLIDKQILRTALWLPILLLSLSACVGNGGKIPEDHYYRLPAIHQTTPANNALFKVPVYIEPVTASGILNERSMLYSEKQNPNEVKHYFYRHWADSPSKMIRQHLVDYLETTKAANTVELDSNSTAIARISVTLLHFERVINGGNTEAKVTLKISYTLPGTRTTTKTYTNGIKAKEASVYASVETFGEALEGIYADWLADVGNS